MGDVFTAAALLIWFRRERSSPNTISAPSAPHQSADVEDRIAESQSATASSNWTYVLGRVYERIGEDRILVIAAGVTFYSLLALFPAIAALVSIYGMFADPASIGEMVGKMSAILPGGATDVIRSEITRVASHGSATLGGATLVALIVSLWSANAGMKALFDGLNVAYHEREERGFIALNLISLCFTICMIAFALISLGAIVAVPYIASTLGDFGRWMATIGQWPLLLIMVSFVFACLYRFGPNRNNAQRWRWLSWGTVLSSVMWLVASILFSWYAANFGSYNKTYGALGAIIGFMTWMWISTIVFMLGGMLNAELEHQTRNDTPRS